MNDDKMRRTIPFSPPDISELEIAEVTEALRSGWITTGPRTKLLERRLAAYIETGKTDLNTEKDPERWNNRVVCLNSATAAEEMNLRVLGIGPGDEVIVPAYTYSASASARHSAEKSAHNIRRGSTSSSLVKSAASTARVSWLVSSLETPPPIP